MNWKTGKKIGMQKLKTVYKKNRFFCCIDIE